MSSQIVTRILVKVWLLVSVLVVTVVLKLTASNWTLVALFLSFAYELLLEVRGKLELVFGRLSLASSGNQLCATEKLMAKKSEEECQIMIQKSFRTPMVRFLRERLEKAGCIVEDNFFKAITCNQEVAGSYVRGEGSLPVAREKKLAYLTVVLLKEYVTHAMIKVCSNYVRIQDDVNQVVIRELIHAFDDCRAANLDWSDCAHHACTEECVRRKVLKSLSANPNCSGFAAEDSLEAVWDVCYNDTLPFDRAP
ncbi:hypothetical protein V8G54_037987 (chloroplast) [Vigna mungo]|uniref:Mitochondrial inner membrane protease ATP23 n=1 Tax=Vigna mungo TaxID=3915 RepID=A0AAQ3MEY9_VIGMU